MAQWSVIGGKRILDLTSRLVLCQTWSIKDWVLSNLVKEPAGKLHSKLFLEKKYSSLALLYRQLRSMLKSIHKNNYEIEKVYGYFKHTVTQMAFLVVQKCPTNWNAVLGQFDIVESGYGFKKIVTVCPKTIFRN